MKTFEIKVNGLELLGKFQSEFDSLHFTGNEIKNGNGIHLIVAHSDYIYISLDKEPKEISKDNDGSIWIGECRSFENKVLWPSSESDEVEKVATELAQVYDDFIKVGV